VHVNDERDDLIHQIIQTQRDLGRALARHQSPLFSSNLTMRQLKVLMLVSANGSATGQELSHHLGVTLGTVTGLVDRLVAHGLVSRHEDPHDRRVRRVELTAEGRKLLEDINNAGLNEYRRIMNHLDTETLRCLHQVTLRLHEAAAALHRAP
jgi:DNA-binding MarR family transcriptional regulator